MLEGFPKALRDNKKKLLLAVAATFFDSISTTLTLLKTSSEELNPVLEATMIGETVLSNTLYISLIPLAAIAVTLVLYSRASNKKVPSTFLEAIIILQVVAGINNTLVYYGEGTPITILLMAAVFGAYAMKSYIYWKLSKIERKLVSQLPN